MDFSKRPLAITDIETTGLNAQFHEIIDIGLIVVDQLTLKILDKFEAKIKPSHIKTAVKKALERNGYNDKDWRKAWDLKDALEIYSEKTENAIVVIQNAYTDWAFLDEGFKKTGVEDLTDYHRIDLFTLGWAKRTQFPGLNKFSLASMAKYFELAEELLPHRAMNGARKTLEVTGKLLKKEA